MQEDKNAPPERSDPMVGCEDRYGYGTGEAAPSPTPSKGSTYKPSAKWPGARRGFETLQFEWRLLETDPMSLRTVRRSEHEV